jgi:acyl-coenzyme A thioesterase PaaI-like protein
MAPRGRWASLHPVTAAPVPVWPPSATTPPDDVEPAVRASGAPAPGKRIPSHYPYCFGCGDLSPAGLHLRITAGEGTTVSSELTVTEHHQGAPGMAHGGLLATAFDETMGFLLWLVGKPAVTARLETDFLLPVPVGSMLFLHCDCLGVQRRKVYVRGVARIGSPDGPVALRAAALFVAVPPEHPSRSSAR